MPRGRPRLNCEFGKSLFWLDPNEHAKDQLVARWIIERPIGQNHTSVRGFRYNDDLDGFLIRDETEARNFAAALAWNQPKPFQLESEEAPRKPYLPSKEDVKALPMIELRGGAFDNYSWWPYDELLREADRIKTAAAEVPPRATRQQLVQFIRDKKNALKVAVNDSQIQAVVSAAKDQLGIT